MLSLIRRRFVYLIYNKKCYSLFQASESNFDVFTKHLNIKYIVRSKQTFKPIPLREGPQPSRYHPGSFIENAEEKIKCSLNNYSTMTCDEWESFKTDIMLDIELLTEENFTSIIMNCLLIMNKLELAHSFLKYLENNNVKPNFLTYLKYAALCGRNHRQVDENLILQSLGKVELFIDRSPVLDMKCVEYIIQGLCATHKWKDSFEYLKKLPYKPNLEIHNSLASAAIRNGDEALAWEILTNWIKDDAPNDRVIEEFLLVALQMQKDNPRQSDIFIKKLFQYMEMKDKIIHQDVVKLITQYFNSHHSKWKISYAKVRRDGYCEKCGHSLKLLDLTNEDFVYLKNAFLERAVKKSDMFINTTPGEFNKYLDFIERNKPFHIVLDGLNTAYTYPYDKSRKNLAFHLMKVIKLLSSRSKKLLVLGKKHMLSWPAYPMRKVSEKAKLFYTENISQDDPFVIYAALASGLHTNYLSADLMRDHMSRLDDPKAIQLFKRWQQSHQILVLADKDFNIKFIEPVRHKISVQGNMDWGWHIPFDDKVILDPYEELNNWLCIQKDL